jgi:sialic acid synthase SpsE
VIEKHFTLDRDLGGPDAEFSLEPAEFCRMVKEARRAASAVGRLDYSLSEEETRRRRSLFVVERLEKDDRIDGRHIRSVRPGHGMAPDCREEVIGRRAASAIDRGEPLTWDCVE